MSLTGSDVLVENDTSKIPILRVADLSIRLPDKRVLFEHVSLELAEGEIVCLLGSSGAGKSTLVTALHRPRDLENAGYKVTHGGHWTRTPIGVVPQRGALFDHLSVRGNIALAMRNSDSRHGMSTQAIGEWIGALDLPDSWATGRSRATARLSGGEAQRVSIARTLAGGRRILFLDEPSVGLDRLRVSLLGELLRREARQRKAAMVVITHDLSFAASCADRVLFASRTDGKVREVELLSFDPSVPRNAEERWRIETDLNRKIDHLLEEESVSEDDSARPGWWKRWCLPRIRSPIRSLSIVPRVTMAAFAAFFHPRDFLEVFWVVLRQVLLRPAPFFFLVSLLLGATVLYIFHQSFSGYEGLPLNPVSFIHELGSIHIIALTPPFAGILFSAICANAVNAWLGGMSLTQQTTALRALGISETRYLWLPAWLGMGISFVALAAIFTLGMVIGSTLYLEFSVPQIEDSFDVVTADLRTASANRAELHARFFFLIALYAVGIGADAIAKATTEKRSAEEITTAMVRSVMASTLWIVTIELISLLLLYGTA